jgi:YD repeat-containing protein
MNTLLRHVLIALCALALIGCQKSKQQSADKAPPENSKLKSITEFRHKFAFGEPEKEGEKQTYTTFSYDSAGKLMEKVSYRKDGELDEKTLYKYNQKGNLITELEYQRYMDFKDPTVTSYEYNDSGKVIDYKREWSKKTSLHYIYSYDARGNLAEVVLEEADGKVSRREKYTYDQNGREVEQLTLESKSNGKWISKYAEDGKITEKEWYKDDGSLNSKYTFTYDSDRQLLESVGRAYPEGRIYAKVTYKYDRSGRVVERCDFTFSDAGEPNRMDRFVYEYLK